VNNYKKEQKMAKKSILMERYFRCGHCGEKYNMKMALRKSESDRSNILRCCHCNKKVGTVS
jgi:transcription elongation factor Elf1